MSRYISPHDYKKLYAKSGNMCALKKEFIFYDDKSLGLSTHYGEQGHIEPYSSSQNAPRGKARPIDEYSPDNSYDNLILLCANCHLQVDQNPDYYSVETLRYIKLGHEKEIEEKLSQQKISHPDYFLVKTFHDFFLQQLIYLRNNLNYPTSSIPNEIFLFGHMRDWFESFELVFFPFEDKQLNYLYSLMCLHYKELKTHLFDYEFEPNSKNFIPIESFNWEKAKFTEINLISNSLVDTINQWLKYCRYNKLL